MPFGEPEAQEEPPREPQGETPDESPASPRPLGEDLQPPPDDEAPRAASPRVGPITVVFAPPRTQTSPGQQVELTLIAGGAERLSSGTINITFDTTAFDVVEVQPGPFLSIDGKEVSFVPFVDQGLIRVEFSRKGDTVGLRGSGHVLRLVLEPTSPGSRTVSAAGSFRDPDGGAIPASFASARIEVQ